MPAGNPGECGSSIVGRAGPASLACLQFRGCRQPAWRYHYGLAFACTELGDIERAQEHFRIVLEMEAPEDLRGLARNGLQEIAVHGLKARGGARMDAVFYPAGCAAAVP